MSRQGYNEDQVVGVLDDELKCKICLAVLRDPVQITGCEHLYCRTCLTEAFSVSRGPRTCPTCRAELPASGGIADAPAVVKRMLNKTRFQCFFGHYEQKDVPGKKPCQWKGELGDFEGHVEKDCPFGALLCPKGCQTCIYRYDIAAHYRVQCSEEEVACKFPGCDSKVKRCKVAEHNTENTTAHLDKMLVAFVEHKLEHVELKRRNTGLETSLAAVKQDQSGLETSLAAVKQDLSHACRRNSYLEMALATVKPDLSFATLTAIANPGTYKFLHYENEKVKFTNNHTTVELRGFFGVDIDGVLEPGKCLDLTCVGVQGRSGDVTFKASTEGKSHNLQFSGVEVGQILRLVLSQDGVLSAMAVGKASHPAPATAWPMGTATKVKCYVRVFRDSTNVYSLN